VDIMFISGVHLDHAWTGLGASFGSALRDWSRHTLALAVAEANHRDAGILLIAGDLFNRSYALPDTVNYASQMLGTFQGNVLILARPTGSMAPACTAPTSGPRIPRSAQLLTTGPAS
jgi:hypothetical protein